MNEPLCVDCQHYEYGFDESEARRLSIFNGAVVPPRAHKCLRLVRSYERRSLVTGAVEVIYDDIELDCGRERTHILRDEFCGPSGKHYVPRAPVAESVAAT